MRVAGVVIALLLAVVIIVPVVLKPKIGDIVKTEANAMLNARLDFEKLDLSLLRHFPHASVELKGLTLTGIDRFEGDTIVAADRISVVVNLMSLFGDEGYEVTKIMLNRPFVSAHKLEDGAVNWDVMKPSDEEDEEEDDEPSSFRLQIKNFTISDGEIVYADDSTKMYFATKPVDLRLKGDMTASETDLDLLLGMGGMDFAMGGTKFLNSAEFEMKSVIAAELDKGRYTLSDNTMRLNAIELSLDGWVQMNDDSTAMDLTMNSSKVQFKDILSMIPAFYTKDFKNLTASGDLTLAAWAKGEMKGDKLPAFNLKLDVANGSFKYAALPKSVDNINIAAQVSNNGGTMDATKVDVSKFGLTMAGNSLSGSFSAATPMSDLQFKAAAKGKVDLGAVKDVYPLDEGINLKGLVTADLSAAGRMSDVEKERYEAIDASGTLTIEGVTANLENLPEVNISRMTATVSPKALALKEMNLTVASSDLSADGSLSNYFGYFLRDDILTGTLNVRSKLLDVNELMAMMPSDGEDGAETAADTADAESAMTAIEVPKNLKLSLAVDLQRILFQKMTLDNFTGRMNVADGKVAIEKLAVDAFDGKVSGSGSYSTAADPKSPKLNLNLGIEKAKFEETFKQLEVVQKLVPIFAKTGGDYSMNFTMSTSLTSDMGVDYDSCNASGTIRSENINIRNIEAFDLLAKAVNNEKLKNISAKDVKIQFEIKNGRLTTSPFDIRMGDITMNLSGSTGLDQSIDYTGKISLPSNATGGVLNNLNLKIGGTFTSPKVSVDVKEAVTNVVNQQIQKLTGSENLNEEFEKQAAKLREEADKAGQKLIDEAKKQKENLVNKASNALTKLAAEKSGDALVKAAEQQAAKLNEEAEKQIDKLREKMNGSN